MKKSPALAPLPPSFYNRDPRQVGRELLGKVLVRRQSGGRMSARIVEVEAYLGEGDLAAHAAAGRTARNSVLFGPPGHAYIYFIYGNHFCLNISCLPDGVPGCVLVRALEPLSGADAMARARGLVLKGKSHLRLLTSGPGRLTEAFGITRERDNAKDLTEAGSDLFVSEDGFRPDNILTTVRIGIRKAAQLPLRYVIAGNCFVSGPKLLSM